MISSQPATHTKYRYHAQEPCGWIWRRQVQSAFRARFSKWQCAFFTKNTPLLRDPYPKSKTEVPLQSLDYETKLFGMIQIRHTRWLSDNTGRSCMHLGMKKRVNVGNSIYIDIQATRLETSRSQVLSPCSPCCFLLVCLFWVRKDTNEGSHKYWREQNKGWWPS